MKPHQTPCRVSPYTHFVKPALVLLLVPCLAVCLACGSAEAGGPPALEVTQGTFAPVVLLTGEVVAEDALPLVAPNVGVWPLQIRWMVEDGTAVATGDLVVELDSTQLTSNLEGLENAVVQSEQGLTSTRARADSELAAAALAVETAEARLAKAILEADLPLEIFAAREADRREAERAKAELELTAARARLEAATTSGAADLQLASATLAQARERVARVEADLERVSLRAGRSGIAVLTEMPWEGRSPRIGDSVWPGQTIATLPDLATVVIEGRLFDVDEGAIAAGLPATITLDAFPERTYAAHVRSVDATARELGRSPLRRAFRVVLTLDAPDPEVLRPGMSARVEVAVPPVDDAVLVPREAISWQHAEAWVTPLGAKPTPVELERCDAHTCLVHSGPPVGTRLAPAEVTR